MKALTAFAVAVAVTFGASEARADWKDARNCREEGEMVLRLIQFDIDNLEAGVKRGWHISNKRWRENAMIAIRGIEGYLRETARSLHILRCRYHAPAFMKNWVAEVDQRCIALRSFEQTITEGEGDTITPPVRDESRDARIQRGMEQQGFVRDPYGLYYKPSPTTPLPQPTYTPPYSPSYIPKTRGCTWQTTYSYPGTWNGLYYVPTPLQVCR